LFAPCATRVDAERVVQAVIRRLAELGVGATPYVTRASERGALEVMA
jgi:hypothetical protein